MLEKIKVIPIAAESLGIRSMCTSVETKDITILLDAGVSLCPKRFGLLPHPDEFKAIIEARKRIARAAEKADVVTISHYHYDHHTPSFEDWLVNWTEYDSTAKLIYLNKTVLVKNPRENINFNQRERAWMFTKAGGKHARKISNADSKTFVFGRTKIRFTEPVFHGSENSGLGWVLMAIVEVDTEKFMFAPDVQGPMSHRPLEIISKEKPQLLMIGGPPLYLSSMSVSENQLNEGLKNLTEITRRIPHVIIDHHIVRDEKWREKAADLFYQTYKSESTVQTAAEFLQVKETPLEAIRKKLFEEKPPTDEFREWMKKSEETRRREKPPV